MSKCSQCGYLIDEANSSCPNCRQRESVKILSQEERDGFTGETIDAPVLTGQKQQHNYYQNTGAGYRHTNTQRIYKFNLLPSSFIGRVLAIFLAGLLILIALPVFLFVVFAGIIAWFLLSRRRR